MKFHDSKSGVGQNFGETPVIMWLRGLKRYQIKNTKITDNYRMTLNGGDLPHWLGNEAVNDRARLLGTPSSRGSLHQELMHRGHVKTGERPDL